MRMRSHDWLKSTFALTRLNKLSANVEQTKDISVVHSIQNRISLLLTLYLLQFGEPLAICRGERIHCFFYLIPDAPGLSEHISNDFRSSKLNQTTTELTTTVTNLSGSRYKQLSQSAGKFAGAKYASASDWL